MVNQLMDIEENYLYGNQVLGIHIVLAVSIHLLVWKQLYSNS